MLETIKDYNFYLTIVLLTSIFVASTIISFKLGKTSGRGIFYSITILVPLAFIMIVSFPYQFIKFNLTFTPPTKQE